MGEPTPERRGCDSDSEELDALTLEGFELLDVQESLGKGSFGVVQKIRRKGTDQTYALKSMKKHEVVDGNLIDQVELEIQVQRKLKHRNVLRLYRHFEDAETVFLLLEFCARGELYQILRTQKCRRFTEDVACNFFCQAADGLMYLHNQNVVHRDIKPENLLVNHDDVLKIADFGWCAVSSTLRTTFCGTLDYLAPEMIQGKGHDHTLDVWSAGVLLYEMVVGRPPFQSTNHGQLISKILKLELVFPAVATPPLQDLVRQLLRTEPRERLSLKRSQSHPWVVANCPAEQKALMSMSPPSSPVREYRQQVSSQAASPNLSAVIGTPGTAGAPRHLWGMAPEQNSRQEDVTMMLEDNDSLIRTLPVMGMREQTEEEPDYEPRTNNSMTVEGRRIVSTEARVPFVGNVNLNEIAPVPRVVPTTPAMLNRALPPEQDKWPRGLLSPRVPGQGQYLSQPAAVSRPPLLNTAMPPRLANGIGIASPVGTPLTVSRTLGKDPQPVQFIAGSSAKSSEQDELSRTWRGGQQQRPLIKNNQQRSMQPPYEPQNVSMERRAASVVRPAGMMTETPTQSVVYRPLLPNSSPPPGPSRALDGNTSGIAKQQEAPGTPGQRPAFRSRTLSPAADGRGTDAAKTVEALRYGMVARPPSQAPQRREPMKRQEPREPLHHASSQNALQRGGALSSAGGAGEPPNLLSSPKLPARRIARNSAAEPSTLSDGVAHERVTGRPPMTAAGVLASPFPAHGAHRSMLSENSIEQAVPRSLLNSTLGDESSALTCSMIREEAEPDVPSARARKPLVPGQRPTAPIQRSTGSNPSSLGSGSGSGLPTRSQPQAMPPGSYPRIGVQLSGQQTRAPYMAAQQGYAAPRTFAPTSRPVLPNGLSRGVPGFQR